MLSFIKLYSFCGGFLSSAKSGQQKICLEEGQSLYTPPKPNSENRKNDGPLSFSLTQGPYMWQYSFLLKGPTVGEDSGLCTDEMKPPGTGKMRFSILALQEFF